MKRRTDTSNIKSFREKYSVKERIFLYYMLFFAILALFTIVTNILYGLDFSFNYKWIGICVFSMTMGILARQRIQIRQVHRIGTYVISLAIFPISWLSSSGLKSPSIIYSIVIMLLINFLLTGLERLLLNAVFLLMNLGLITLYHTSPGLFMIMTPQEQYLDWIINVPIVFTFIALLLTIFERAYENERIMNVKKNRKMEIMSRTDPLTGLANKMNLEIDIEDRIRKLETDKTVFSLIFMDIDYFKKYNDTYGHLKGDDCLRKLSSIMQESIRRDNDKLYRFGGEEFIILLSATDRAGALLFAEKLQSHIVKASIPHISSDIADTITASMGIATAESSHLNSSVLLKQADKALYQAKETGRNRIVCFEDVK